MNIKEFKSWLDHRSQLSLDSPLEKPLIMGILNITPDSFSDGGMFLSTDSACRQAIHMLRQGADIIDIGGQSTKPGTLPVPLDVELQRVIPVIRGIRVYSNVCISIDTDKPEVMEAAVTAGANIINDVSALGRHGALAMAAKLAVPVCLMHMKGEPYTMQQNPHYSDGVMSEIVHFFTDRIDKCIEAGIEKRHLILDPGFGFGKSDLDNLCLVNKLDKFTALKIPLLLGVSRKSTLGTLLGKEVGERLIGGIALAVYATLKGVGIIRTHDVDETNQALKLVALVSQANY